MGVCNRSTLVRLRDSISVAGIILMTATKPATGGISTRITLTFHPYPQLNDNCIGFSTEEASPQSWADIHGGDYEWNSYGDGAALESFPFAIIHALQPQTDYLLTVISSA
jgi:hypothetical protein